MNRPENEPIWTKNEPKWLAVSMMAVANFVLIILLRMRIKTDIPQIARLRDEVCVKAGFVPMVHAEFAALAVAIERELRKHISETTLERLWNYSTRGYKTVYEHTLDLLCQYVGDDSWQSFLRRYQTGASAPVPGFAGNVPPSGASDVIITAELEPGVLLRIGWRPDRICEVRYIGDSRFLCLSSRNTFIQPGDTFSCDRIESGRPLCLERFVPAPDSELTYTIGHKNGLTGVEVLS